MRFSISVLQREFFLTSGMLYGKNDYRAKAQWAASPELFALIFMERTITTMLQSQLSQNPQVMQKERTITKQRLSRAFPWQE
jgi:hypothetical protein